MAVGYNAFGAIGDGLGVTGSLGYASRSGLQLGSRGEYYFRRLLTAESDRAVGLRQSIPFWPVLSEEQRQRILAEADDGP